MQALYMLIQYLKQRFAKDEEGQGLVEYTLIIILIALAVLAAVNPVAEALNAAFSRISSSIVT